MNHVLRAVPVPHRQHARNEDQTEASSTDPGLVLPVLLGVSVLGPTFRL